MTLSLAMANGFVFHAQRGRPTTFVISQIVGINKDKKEERATQMGSLLLFIGRAQRKRTADEDNIIPDADDVFPGDTTATSLGE